jgi:hypothetical protein
VTVQTSSELVLLTEAEWRHRAARHEELTDAWTIGWRDRRSLGQQHPVDDFLFTYYSFRPSALRRWHPGLGVAVGGDASDILTRRDYIQIEVEGAAYATLSPSSLIGRLSGFRWITELLSSTQRKEPRFGCFGLHEWAMVYGQQQDQIRHQDWPLRRSPEQIRATVDQLGLRCTHFDAFRFFTPEAVPHNLVTIDLQPLSRERQADVEQGGCLHANMDLYKWAMKLAPAISSELTTDCFAFAREVRTVDMQASPYDFRALELEPIDVESEAGRAQFVSLQREFAAQAAELRERLLDAARSILRAVTDTGPTRT